MTDADATRAAQTRLDLDLDTAPRAMGTDREPQPGTTIGRYVVIDRLGAGAMGVVYAAYDPQLDRKIALKLLQPRAVGTSGGTSARARLLREAKALARVAHPNVVAVHDVGELGVASHDGPSPVFIAMEFVDGVSLRQWLAERGRPWPQIVEVFVAAAHGLAAAHDLGVVHRDIKPDNLMIDRNGRVRVMDFGIARATEDESAPAVVPAIVVADDADDDPGLTRTGAILGTPAYMSPEQHRSGRVDGRSDQYSLAVALYEALFGVRPFDAKDIASLAFAVLHEDPAPIPAGTDVPRSITAAIERGLSRTPQARFADMRAFAAALQVVPPRRRRWALGVAALGIVGTTWAIASRPDDPCAAAGTALEGAWDDDARRALDDALAAHPQAAAVVRRRLDAYAQVWTDARIDACEATHVRHEQSAELMDRRVFCLQRQREELTATVSVIAEADATAQVSSLLDALASPDACSAEAVIASDSRAPTDAATREQVAALSSELATIQTQARVGRSEGLVAPALAVCDAAEATGHRPTVARARLALGWIYANASRYEDAVAEFDTAQRAAVLADAHELAAWVHLALARIVGHELRHADAGRAHARAAEIHMEASADAPALRILLARTRSTIAFTESDYPAALHTAQIALTEAASAYGDGDSRTAWERANVAYVLRTLGRLDEARDAYERAIADTEAELGPDHPSLAAMIVNLAQVHELAGAPQQSRTLAARGVALARQRSNRLLLAVALRTVGRADQALGRLAQAQATFVEAADITRETFGTRHHEYGSALANLGSCQQAQGDSARALATYEEALTAIEASVGERHSDVAVVLSAIGDIHADAGRADAATAAYGRALALFERTLGPEHVHVANVAVRLGNVQAASGDLERAHDNLTRALQLHTAGYGEHHEWTASTALALGDVDARLGRRDEATAAWRQAAGGPDGDADASSTVARARLADPEAFARDDASPP